MKQYVRRIDHDKVGFILGIQGCFNVRKINTTHQHAKDENRTVLADVRKHFTKFSIYS
jgi:hypothetical protein